MSGTRTLAPATHTESSHPPYTGRFAPTPSGPLHLGSLLAATASWLDARANRGRWLLRIDDLDRPRVAANAETSILASLAAHGLWWDGPVWYQSDHAEHYRAALRKLEDRCFACRCTRKTLRGSARYPGTCRELRLPRAGNAVRIHVSKRTPRYVFEDRVQGRFAQDVAAEVGDFIVWRRDDMASYPLAVVVDDALMGVTHVVRGVDLLDNTPRQLHLIDRLGLTPPSYGHLPVIVESSGVKLSKRNAVTRVDDRTARHNIAAVLSLIGLEPPQESVDIMLDWAVRHWHMSLVPKARTLAGFVGLTV